MCGWLKREVSRFTQLHRQCLFQGRIAMGKYTRKTERQSWDENSMRQAVEEVLEGRLGYLKASKEYGVPRTTIEARVKKIKQGALNREDSAKKGLGRHKPVFSPAQEKELVEYILCMESRLFGLTLDALRSLAFELAQRNGMPNRFNKTKKKAGKAWLYAFLNRHPNLKLRSPEPTSLARAMGFNRPSVEKFFSLITETMEKHKIPPERIYNVDETGIMTVPKKRSKCLSLRGKRQVGCLSSAERGVLVSVEICMSASGAFMPPSFIFPRARAKPELLDDAPPGSTAHYHPSGWMQTEIFLSWFDKFIAFSNPSKENPVLLLLDGHATHTKNIELIHRARDNGVVLLCFPPHTTHRLQPLDVSFMSPLSTYYSSEVQRWMQQHPGRPITISQIGKLFGNAFMKAASVQTAVSGFRKTGIHPLNPEIFPDWMFKPAETTNRSIQGERNDNRLPEPRNSPPRTPPRTPPTSLPRSPLRKPPSTTPIPTEQFYANSTPSCSHTTQNFVITPQQVVPVPHSERKINLNDKRRGKTAVLTSTPYKEELEESISKRLPTKKPKLNLGDNDKTAHLSNLNKKGKIKDSEMTTRNDVKVKYPKKKDSAEETSVREKNQKNIKRRKSKDNNNSSSEDEREDAACIFCSELYSNSKAEEGWIRCQHCEGWAHEACAGVGEEEDEVFSCDFCQ